MANLVTAALVGSGAALGLPMSTTHVSAGAIIAVGSENAAGLKWKTVRKILLAWVVTLPAAALLGVLFYALLHESSRAVIGHERGPTTTAGCNGVMKSFLKLAGGLGLLGALLLLERRRPLRVEKESKLRRVQRNLAVAALSAITIHFVESLVITPLAEMVKKKRWGLLKQRRLPRIVDTLAALAILDYTLYLQHVLHHRVPLLWRFHAVHHVDLDLDTSTALRFHFGEIALSIPYRIAQVLLIGVDPRLVNRLANLFVAVDCVLSLQFAAAHLHRRSLGSGHRDATHAWYSSFK